MQEFIHRSASSGIVLVLATVLALLWANSPFAPQYNGLLKTYIGVSVGSFQIKETTLHWITMA
jgi:NhaA family Na+:H+ antiporter